jgi:rhomboid family GlyGly-CTERM serine protease
LADPGRRAWLTFCAVLAAGALAGWALPAPWLDWQPARAAAEAWRAWTAAFVHWSPLHLGGNLAGCAVLAAFGAAARVPLRATAAWALAWPLTHALLLVQPALVHYGGLSGVLHAGVAVAALSTWGGSPAHRRIGGLVLAGLGLKLLLERPWAGPLAQPAGWDIAVAPLAHATGALSGVACALMLGVSRRRPATMPAR